jgi:glutamate synthase domain-containing protein 1
MFKILYSFLKECEMTVWEHDACGVGFVCHTKGEKSHQIVRWGIEAVKNLTHRGAVGGDGKTGDGAGILLEIPRKFFADYIEENGTLHKLFGQSGCGCGLSL